MEGSQRLACNDLSRSERMAPFEMTEGLLANQHLPLIQARV